MNRTPKTKKAPSAETPETPETPDKVSVRVVRMKTELDGGLVVSLSMRTDTPDLPAPIAEALQTLNLVEINEQTSNH